jgi:transcriptional regulator GlxA family with amidase domain
MPRLAVLVQPGATPSSVTTTLDIFNVANRFPDSDPCRVELLSDGGGSVRLSETVAVETKRLPVRIEGFDAIIVPGFFATDAASLFAQLRTVWQPVVERLRRLEGNPVVAASCYGTFVLAESGLLDNRRATTSWWFGAEFATRYPNVRLAVDKALMEDGKLFTAGAMTAHAELSMAVLRCLKGAELAHDVGSVMLIGEGKTSQRPFMAVPRRFADPLAQSAADWMALRLGDAFSAQDLATACHVSYRTLHRRFRAAAGMAPQEYLRAIRVERAKALLESGCQSIEQIVAQVGYADVPSFRRLFARLTGVSPAQYRRRFRR